MTKADSSVYIECYGCNEGRLECARLQKYLEDNGLKLIDNPGEANLLVFWGCALTEEKARTSHLTAWKLSELRKPGAKLVIWACLPDIDASMVPRVRDCVAIGRGDVAALESLVESKVKYRDIAVNYLYPRKARRWAEIRSFITEDPVSALVREIHNKVCQLFHADYVKGPEVFQIMTARGCLSNCTFCSERATCGKLQSEPKEKIISEFEHGLKAGFHYFALVATDLGAYGRDLGYTLLDLLNEMERVEGNYSLVLYNVNPIHLREMWDGLLPMFEKGRVAELEVSAQCASDSLLRLMGRQYTAGDFKVMVRELRERFRGLFLATGVMVGFPRESEEDFRRTIGLLDRNLFDHVDVYRFSKRPTVPASRLKGQVPERVARRRYRQILLKASLCEIRSALRRRRR